MQGTKKKNKLMVIGNKKNRWWIYLAIAIVVLYVIIYVLPSVTGALKSTYVAKYGELEIEDETTMYLVREEKVYNACTSGTINQLATEGQMVKKGTAIVALDPKPSTEDEKISDRYAEIVERLDQRASVRNSKYKCESSGVASYYADGYEGIFTIENRKKLTEEKVKGVKQKDVEKLKRDQAVKGEPLFKIVCNTKWYTVCWLSNIDAKKYEVGTDVTLFFGEDEVVAHVDAKVKQDNKTLLVFKTNRYFEAFDKIRVADVRIVSSKNTGLVLETKSIKEEKGIKGVYVKNTLGDFTFTPISILATDGDVTIAEKSYFYDKDGNYVETVSTYDQVLR